MSVTLEVPGKLLADALEVDEAELPRHLIIELACALYARNCISLGNAAQLAEVDPFEMGKLLALRNIPRHYNREDLDADLQYSRGE